MDGEYSRKSFFQCRIECQWKDVSMKILTTPFQLSGRASSVCALFGFDPL